MIAKCGCPIESKDSRKQTPLHLAIVSGCLANVSALLELGADIRLLVQSTSILELEREIKKLAMGRIDIIDLLMKRLEEIYQSEPVSEK